MESDVTFFIHAERLFKVARLDFFEGIPPIWNVETMPVNNEDAHL